MGIEYKEWFVLGLVGTIIAIGGVISLIMGLMMIRTANRMLNMSYSMIIFMHLVYSEIGTDMEAFFLLDLFMMANRYTRMKTIFRIPFYLGICIAFVGGILAITGWSKYFILKRGEKY
ncbi:MAG: hypothetical protein HWN67_20770 [Candidatus Helarchaeota archaeon]|nr:hypothetical protein [Candidatus Helarchaeota archaeon]